MNEYDHSKTLVRKRPARENATCPKLTEYIFVTCCTRSRLKVLNTPLVHDTLRKLWSDTTYWTVLSYVIMPDHVHLMAFSSRSNTFSIRSWGAWWKGKVSQALGYRAGTLWLPNLWDTRMRSDAHLAAKLLYMRENPVRAGLVESAEMWPFRGELEPRP
jgi:putative transposase